MLHHGIALHEISFTGNYFAIHTSLQDPLTALCLGVSCSEYAQYACEMLLLPVNVDDHQISGVEMYIYPKIAKYEDKVAHQVFETWNSS